MEASAVREGSDAAGRIGEKRATPRHEGRNRAGEDPRDSKSRVELHGMTQFFQVPKY